MPNKVAPLSRGTEGGGTEGGRSDAELALTLGGWTEGSVDDVSQMSMSNVSSSLDVLVPSGCANDATSSPRC